MQIWYLLVVVAVVGVIAAGLVTGATIGLVAYYANHYQQDWTPMPTEHTISPYDRATNLRDSIRSAKSPDVAEVKGSPGDGKVYVEVEDKNGTILDQIEERFVPRDANVERTTVGGTPMMLIELS
jgi:hypothetical protein